MVIARVQSGTYIRSMRISRVPLLLALFLVTLSPAVATERWVPQRCHELVGEPPDESWNEPYDRGFRAIQREDFQEAEQEMCQALLLAREFEPRDWRFAETLDELGHVAFALRDFLLAEQFQGAAIAEMLLAVGPGGEPFADTKPSDRSPIRSDCRSGIHSYTTRLGWIHNETQGRIAIDKLQDEPWRIFSAGYLPLDRELAERLDWLISRYLLEEDIKAADALRELQRRIDSRSR
jgi:hypothetical protein